MPLAPCPNRSKLFCNLLAVVCVVCDKVYVVCLPSVIERYRRAWKTQMMHCLKRQIEAVSDWQLITGGEEGGREGDSLGYYYATIPKHSVLGPLRLNCPHRKKSSLVVPNLLSLNDHRASSAEQGTQESRSQGNKDSGIETHAPESVHVSADAQSTLSETSALQPES
jgi:hypothetical protein